MIRIASITGLAFVCLVLFLPTAQAEEGFELTRCYAGTGTLFHKVKALPMALSWAENGIVMSSDKRFNNMVVHCEGSQFGLREKRKGYGICTMKDDDGDIIILEMPYSGMALNAKFLSGSGKWKGIKGGFNTDERIVRSKFGKGAMPGTYQGCRKITGTFELLPR